MRLPQKSRMIRRCQQRHRDEGSKPASPARKAIDHECSHAWAPPDTKACRAHHLILYVLRPATFALVAPMVACSAAPATETPAASRSDPASAAAVTALPAPATTCPAVRPVSLGAITGRLAYPSEFIPKLVVFAMMYPMFRQAVVERVIPGHARLSSGERVVTQHKLRCATTS